MYIFTGNFFIIAHIFLSINNYLRNFFEIYFLTRKGYMCIYIKYIIKVFLIFVLEIRHSMGEIDCKMLIIENIGSRLNEIFRI